LLNVDMNAKAVICVFAGHRWSEATDVYEAFPVLQCRRCGRTQGLASETQRPEGWMERQGRDARASQFQDGRIQRRP
jgi:hypothetical protein